MVSSCRAGVADEDEGALQHHPPPAGWRATAHAAWNMMLTCTPQASIPSSDASQTRPRSYRSINYSEPHAMQLHLQQGTGPQRPGMEGLKFLEARRHLPVWLPGLAHDPQSQRLCGLTTRQQPGHANNWKLTSPDLSSTVNLQTPLPNICFNPVKL